MLRLEHREGHGQTPPLLRDNDAAGQKVRLILFSSVLMNRHRVASGCDRFGKILRLVAESAFLAYAFVSIKGARSCSGFELCRCAASHF